MWQKKEKDSEDIMLKIADINTGKIVNCYICKQEIPIKEIKKHVTTCSRNKRDLPVKIKIKKEIQCDLCGKKFTYNTALYKHFKNVHHQGGKTRWPQNEKQWKHFHMCVHKLC